MLSGLLRRIDRSVERLAAGDAPRSAARARPLRGVDAGCSRLAHRMARLRSRAARAVELYASQRPVLRPCAGACIGGSARRAGRGRCHARGGRGPTSCRPMSGARRRADGRARARAAAAPITATRVRQRRHALLRRRRRAPRHDLCAASRPAIPLRRTTCRVELDGLRPGAWIAAHRGHRRRSRRAAPGPRRAPARSRRRRARAALAALPQRADRARRSPTRPTAPAACAPRSRPPMPRPKPALVQFAAGLAGTVTLAAPLPRSAAGQVTIDGFDVDGVAADAHDRRQRAQRRRAAHHQRAQSRSRPAHRQRRRRQRRRADRGPERERQPARRRCRWSAARCSPAAPTGVGCVLDGVCRRADAAERRAACAATTASRVRDFAGAAERRTGSSAARSVARTRQGHQGLRRRRRGRRAQPVHRQRRRRPAGDARRRSSPRSENVMRREPRHQQRERPGGQRRRGRLARSAGRLETRGNLSIGNALRGISVRSLSVARAARRLRLRQRRRRERQRRRLGRARRRRLRRRASASGLAIAAQRRRRRRGEQHVARATSAPTTRPAQQRVRVQRSPARRPAR